MLPPLVPHPCCLVTVASVLLQDFGNPTVHCTLEDVHTNMTCVIDLLTGGPVFNEVGECVGIAFQSLSGSDAENIGYVIPTPVIQHFLTDFRYACLIPCR